MKKSMIATIFVLTSLLLIPSLALAKTGASEITLRASDEQLSFSAPLTVPFAFTADGRFIVPQAADVCIVNNSIFPINVSAMQVIAGEGMNLVSNDGFAAASENDTLWTTVSPDAGTTIEDFQAFSGASGAPLQAGNWNLGKAGSEHDEVELSFEGMIKNPVKDYSGVPIKAYDVTWTCIAGTK